MVDAELIANSEPPLSYFEALTVLTFACFADAPVDVAVVEAGMGGEWDSTNVADGDVAVLTPIAMDHVEHLGPTLRDIARTKSGIIKPASRVVSALQSDEAWEEIVTACTRFEAPLAVLDRDFFLTSAESAVGGQLLSVSGLAGQYRDLFLPLL
jgi:dihydrofolate synthase/folylpolyglutamate synthase